MITPYTKNVCCIGYIDNAIVAQQGQAGDLAYFKRWNTGGRCSTADKAFIDSVRALNPAIEVLTYLECTARNIASGTGAGGGPGYDVLRGAAVGDATGIAAAAHDTCVELNGTLLVSGGTYRYDWRKPLLRERFLAAIDAIYAAYPFAGIQIDNGSGWNDAHPDSLVRDEMYACRQATYYEAVARHPDKIFYINGDRPFRGINGEMCENRLSSWTTELPEHVAQKQPRFDLGVWTTPTTIPTDAQIQAQMQIAFNAGAWFYWCQNYQHVQRRDALYA